MSRVRVYEYGLLPPISNSDLVVEQMQLGHKYRNKLIEIELKRRNTVRVAQASHPDTEALEADLAALQTQADEIRDRIAAVRKKTRKRAESSEDRDRLKALVTTIKAKRAELGAAKLAIRTDPVIQKAFADSTEAAKVATKAARAACGAYWGTYLLAEQAAQQAAKSKTDPHFMRWQGEGRVSVQLQGGIALDELATDSQLRILEPALPDYRLGRRRGQRRRLMMRVQSEGRDPVWAVWPMTMHRPIPEGSRIKIACVSRRKQDCRTWQWRVQITVELPEGHQRRPIPSDGVVALNLGWCERPSGGIRSGYVASADGQHREIVVPKSIIERLEKSASIHSYRDKDLNEMKGALGHWFAETWSTVRPDLAGWLRAVAKESPSYEWLRQQLQVWIDHPLTTDTPEWVIEHVKAGTTDEIVKALAAYFERPIPIPWWFLEATKTMPLWRSPERFRSFTYYWRAHRWDGDAVVHDILEKWRYRDEHLERYESGLRRGALGHRREIYRIFAANLASTYQHVVVDTTDLSKLAMAPDRIDGVDDGQQQQARRQRTMAAPYELRMAIANAFGKERMITVESRGVTATCHSCQGNEMTALLEESRMRTCASCSTTWDQDHNACLNLLARARDAQTDHDGSMNESRWSRLKRQREETKQQQVSPPT